jgi:hypothetical protein
MLLHVSANNFGHLQGATSLIDVRHDILHKGRKAEFTALKIGRHCPLILLLKVSRRQDRALRSEGKVIGNVQQRKEFEYLSFVLNFVQLLL